MRTVSLALATALFGASAQAGNYNNIPRAGRTPLFGRDYIKDTALEPRDGGNIFFPRAGSSSACNGYSELCGRKFNEVAFATTHNSFAYGDNIAANQNNDIKAQLDAGIRGFMIDLHRQSGRSVSRRDLSIAAAKPSSADSNSSSNNSSSNEPYLCHTVCALYNGGPLIDQLRNYKTFLDKNSNEVITIFIENADNFSASEIKAQFDKAGLTKYAYSPSGGSSTNTTWPTLQTMIKDNKRMVVFVDTNNVSSDVPWLMYEKSYVVQTSFDVPSGTQFNCNPISEVHPLWVMNHFSYTNYNYGSTTVQRPDPDNAAKVNAKSSIDAQYKSCLSGNHFPNFITVDFYDKGDLLKSVAAINKVDYKNTTTDTFSSSDNSSKNDDQGSLAPITSAALPLSVLVILATLLL